MTTLNPELKYSTNPDISVENKLFCFTGKFDGTERTDLERFVEGKGGAFAANVSEETDYLVIGSLGTRCCSFSCCKRVVESGCELIEKGAALQLIKEVDFAAVFKA